MKTLWVAGKFTTNFYCPCHGYLKKVMIGVTNGIIGIDERNSLFHITHLNTGCGTYVSRSEQGARRIAEYLTTHYQSLLDSVKVSDSTVSNIVHLQRLINADEDFNALLSKFALTDDERKNLGLMPEHRLNFIS